MYSLGVIHYLVQRYYTHVFHTCDTHEYYIFFNSVVDYGGDQLTKPQVPGLVMTLGCDVGYTPVVTDDNNVTQCDLESKTWTTTGFECRRMYHASYYPIIYGSDVLEGIFQQ